MTTSLLPLFPLFLLFLLSLLFLLFLPLPPPSRESSAVGETVHNQKERKEKRERRGRELQLFSHWTRNVGVGGGQQMPLGRLLPLRPFGHALARRNLCARDASSGW